MSYRSYVLRRGGGPIYAKEIHDTDLAHERIAASPFLNSGHTAVWLHRIQEREPLTDYLVGHGAVELDLRRVGTNGSPSPHQWGLRQRARESLLGIERPPHLQPSTMPIIVNHDRYDRRNIGSLRPVSEFVRHIKDNKVFGIAELKEPRFDDVDRVADFLRRTDLAQSMAFLTFYEAAAIYMRVARPDIQATGSLLEVMKFATELASGNNPADPPFLCALIPYEIFGPLDNPKNVETLGYVIDRMKNEYGVAPVIYTVNDRATAEVIAKMQPAAILSDAPWGVAEHLEELDQLWDRGMFFDSVRRPVSSDLTLPGGWDRYTRLVIDGKIRPSTSEWKILQKLEPIWSNKIQPVDASWSLD